MSHIYNIIGNECVINIANWNHNVTSVTDRIPIKIQSVLDLGKKNSGKLLFQNIIGCFLQISIQRQIHIIASFWFCRLNGVQNFTNVIYI